MHGKDMRVKSEKIADWGKNNGSDLEVEAVRLRGQCAKHFVRLGKLNKNKFDAKYQTKNNVLPTPLLVHSNFPKNTQVARLRGKQSSEASAAPSSSCRPHKAPQSIVNDAPTALQPTIYAPLTS